MIAAIDRHGSVALASSLAPRRRMRRQIALLLILWVRAAVAAADVELHERVLRLAEPADDGHRLELAWLDQHWQSETPAFLLDVVRFVPTEATAIGIFDLLRRRNGREGVDWAEWNRWYWNESVAPPAHYADFKSRLYRNIDPRFARYFAASRPASIRLDEVVWGGVRQDGIPPLRGPKMITAGEAGYLEDGNVVFGIEVNGDARAYPRRILAWHEMFVDSVGGVDVAGVYCTLCGTMVLYETRVGGRLHGLGTSGFLYHSNKLMYDQDTQSLWSTLEGRPVIGPLVGQGIVLRSRTVVTTTWGEWRRRHPSTRVLSPDTGHRRDYGEGVAYQEYFATDALMFPVPGGDDRLRNKEEVLVLRFGGDRDQPLAIASTYLRAHPVHHAHRGGTDYVVLTDRSGAHRVYGLTRGQRIEEWDGDAVAVDGAGMRWRLTESALTAEGRPALPRLPSHNAFWFGWRAAFPKTELIQ